MGSGSHSSAGRWARLGFEFEDLVTSWLAEHLLVGSMPWRDFPARAHIESVWRETHDAVDDIVVKTSVGGRVFIQAKRSIDLAIKKRTPETGTSSRVDAPPFEKALTQCVKQHRSAPLDPAKDSLVIVSESMGASLHVVHGLLGRFRGAPPDEAGFEEPLAPSTEAIPFKSLRSMLGRLWLAEYGTALSWADLCGFLRALELREVTRNDQCELVDALALRALVVPPANEVTLWAHLDDVVHMVGTGRAGFDLHGLRTLLRRAGLPLREPPDYRADWARIRVASDTAISTLVAETRLRWNEHELSLDREITTDVLASLLDGSLLLCGEPGAGKSRVLADVAQRLRNDERTVILLDAGNIPSTLAGLKEDLGLTHGIRENLRGVADPLPAYMLIDALDRTHGETLTVVRKLIDIAHEQPRRWRVLASVRTFDLLHGNWAKQFPGPPLTLDGTLVKARAFKVPLLGDEEIARLLAPLPEHLSRLEAASERTRSLFRAPFYLRLAAEVDPAGTRFASAAGAPELFDLFWSDVVVNGRASAEPALGDLRAALLLHLAKQRFEYGRVETLLDPGTPADVVRSLKSDGVLAVSAGFGRFTHDLIFNHCLTRYFGSHSDEALAALVDRSSLKAAARFRPTLHAWLDGQWTQNRQRFWDVVDEVFGTSGRGGPGVSRVVVAEAIVRNAAGEGNLSPLAMTERAKILRFTLDFAAATKTRLTVPGWLTLAEDLAARPGRAATPGARILCMVMPSATAEERGEFGVRLANAACRLLEGTWQHPELEAQDATWPVQAVIEAARFAPSAAEAVLQRLLTKQTRPHRYESVMRLVRHLHQLEDCPGLIGALFCAIADDLARVREENSTRDAAWFKAATAGEDNDDVGATPPSRMPVPETLRSQWESIEHLLTEYAPRFLEIAPSEATASLARAVRRFGVSNGDDLHLIVRGRRFPSPPANDRLLGAGMERKFADAIATEIVNRAKSGDDSIETMLDELAECEAPAVIWDALVRQVEAEPRVLDWLPELFAEWSTAAHLSSALRCALRTGFVSPERIDALRVALKGVNNDQVPTPWLWWLSRLRNALDGDDDRSDEPAVVGGTWPESEVEDWSLRYRHGLPASEIAAPANAEVRSWRRLAEKAASYLRDRVQGVLPAVGPASLDVTLNIVQRVVGLADGAEVSSAVAGEAWGAATMVASLATRHGDVRHAEVLFRASERPVRAPVSSKADLLNQLSGEAMYEAVAGLVALAKGGDARAASRVHDLVCSPHDAVRHEVAWNLDTLASIEFSSDIATLVQDRHPAVVAIAMRSLGRFFGVDPSAALDESIAALEREWPEGDMPDPSFDRSLSRIRESALRYVTFYIVRPDLGLAGIARPVWERVLANIAEFEDGIRAVLHAYHDGLDFALHGDDKGWLREESRRQTWALLADCTQAALSALIALRASSPAKDSAAKHEAIGKILGHIAFWPYATAMGIRDDDASLHAGDSERRARLVWENGRDLFDHLGTARHPETAERVLETLEIVLRAANFDRGEVEQVLRKFLGVAHSAVAAGFAERWSGFDAVDRALRWVLAEQRMLLERHDQTISEIVDAFLDAGHFNAYELARDLDLSR